MRLSDKAKQIIGAVAPTLGAALGGPLGGLAGNVLASVVGGGDASKVEAAILGQNPETLLALKKADQEFTARMRELDIREEELAGQDRASARGLFSVNQRPQIWLSVLFVGGYFLFLALLVSGDVHIPESIKDTVLLLLGVITREVPTIMQFWFGSSIGSKTKEAQEVR